ncbi:MAG TPA: type III polyketide synthase, partial [Phnomibacter sp.]|nr:type III polyketide synthase [Phnomibacter sp.]
MANIVSIGTAVPAYCHRQQDILQFMQLNFGLQAAEARKLGFLYHQSGIETRYSVLDCFSPPFTRQPFGNEYTAIAPLSERMTWYLQHAAPLSMQAVQACIHGHTTPQAITHLITVSCTGMSAPGLDLELVHLLGLAPQVFRTSVNFMGCYAAIHALKLAHLICTGQPNAQVLVVATELCT